MWELGRDVCQERCTSANCKLCPMYCNANQSPCLGGRCSPMLERELNLAYSLFRVQVPKGRSAQACRSEKDNSGGVTTKSAFRKDDVHSLLLNSRQFLQTEMTVGQWVSNACQVDGISQICCIALTPQSEQETMSRSSRNLWALPCPLVHSASSAPGRATVRATVE